LNNGEEQIHVWDENLHPPFNWRRYTKLGIIIGLVVLALAFLFVAKGIYTDWLWFDGLGFLGPYQKVLTTRIWLFVVAFLVAAVLLGANLYIAYRLAWGESLLPVPPEVIRLSKMAIIGGAVAGLIVISLIFGVAAQGRWETVLVYMNRVPFDVVDPQFGRDMSFHVAVMPLLHLIQGWLMALVIVITVSVAALYVAIYAMRGLRFELAPKVLVHAAVLGVFLMMTIAGAHYLDIYELVFSGRGAAPGAGYTDVNARIPVLWLLVAISLVSAVGFGASIFYGGARTLVAAFSLWAAIAILAGGIYPTAYQRLRVKPNEFDREERYIQRAIDSTLIAYNFAATSNGDVNEPELLIDERQFTEYTPWVDPREVFDTPDWYSLSEQERRGLFDGDGTTKNIRLWDHRPLRDTYNQIRTFRQFYNFVGVDVDRYRFDDGEVRQVMLSARELFPENLDSNAQNWVNRKLSYTHGYSVAMSPVTEFTEEGEPVFFVHNIPPDPPADLGLSLTRPEIYYGENTKGFVVVNTETDEFDYPGPEGSPVYQDYAGTGGVNIGSLITKAAFAWEMVDFNLLISGQINSESKIQFRREIRDRVRVVAPFLTLDRDPYLVIGDNGKLWWIMDAYTTTDRFAYSQDLEGEYNYIRNSIKVVIDPYNGTMSFFVIEPDEPIVRIYRNAFPDLFSDFDEIDELDPALRNHIRYPMDLFTAQSEIYLRYHMRDPEEFFPSNDLWARAQEVFITPVNTQAVEPYYVMMKLPGEEKEEFVLLLPFTPGGEERKNMVAWMAARNDGDNYGKLVNFIFPEGQVDGPEQIEGRITSDEEIGRELSLLCPEGKECIRGNLLAIPIADAFLYVEPLYIQAEALTFPQLKKVIVADGDNVFMEDTLFAGLNRLFDAGRDSGDLDVGPVDIPPPDEPDPTPGVTPTPSPGDPPDVPPEGLEGELEKIGAALDDLKESLGTLEEVLERINETRRGESQ
jgi:uncharacterized membrane protein (UPF0182 family)